MKSIVREAPPAPEGEAFIIVFVVKGMLIINCKLIVLDEVCRLPAPSLGRDGVGLFSLSEPSPHHLSLIR